MSAEIADKNIASFDDFFEAVGYSKSKALKKKPAGHKAITAGSCILAICDEDKDLPFVVVVVVCRDLLRNGRWWMVVNNGDSVMAML